MAVSTAEETLLRGTEPLHKALEERVRQSLDTRLSRNSEYTHEEIARITVLDRALFPSGFALDKESSEQFRALCMLSRCALATPDKIRSHRPFIGPLIVLLKRICWRVLNVQLRETFDALQEFNSWVVYSQAKQHYELKSASSAPAAAVS